MVGGGVAGAVAAKVLVSKIPVKNPLVQSLIPIALGVVLIGNKSEFVKGLGIGMAAIGGVTLIGSFDKSNKLGLNGISDMVLNGTDTIEGAGDYYGQEMLNGYDDDMNGVINGESSEFMAGAEAEFMA